jgi:hypothetical protein
MWDSLAPTADETVRIEEQGPGYVRYQSIHGDRWEVRGICDHRGYCLIGAVVDTPDGLIQIESLEHIEQLKQQYGEDRVFAQLDVPVGPGFEGCCPLEITVLAA